MWTIWNNAFENVLSVVYFSVLLDFSGQGRPLKRNGEWTRIPLGPRGTFPMVTNKQKCFPESSELLVAEVTTDCGMLQSWEQSQIRIHEVRLGPHPHIHVQCAARARTHMHAYKHTRMHTHMHPCIHTRTDTILRSPSSHRLNDNFLFTVKCITFLLWSFNLSVLSFYKIYFLSSSFIQKSLDNCDKKPFEYISSKVNKG